MSNKMKESFDKVLWVNHVGSWGETEPEKVTMRFNVTYNPETDYGSFEQYDTESAGERYYAEGGLWFDKGVLVDYDGIYSLSEEVLDNLEEWGLDVKNMRRLLE